MTDFTYCPIDIEANYGGSDQKRGVIYNGDRYMLKLPDRISSEKRISLNDTYSNSIYSEKVSCDILAALGFKVQSTILGTFNDKPVVACKNFIPKGAVLLSFRTVANTILPEKIGRIPKISEIYEVLTQDSVYFTAEGRKAAFESYWDLFILDAFLGNFDRHGDNWGYLKLEGSTHLVPSPIYDCGSCLYPKLADSAIQSVVFNSEEVAKRVDVFPQAALLLDNGEKANYKNFIGSLSNPDCTAALLRIFPRIDMDMVNKVISNNPDLTDTRKFFYTAMLGIRYDRILKPAYNKANVSIYTLCDLEHDHSTLMKVMEKHWDYKAWFVENFPNGAPSKEAVLDRLSKE